MIYMDSAATTPMSDAALSAMEPYWQREFGNSHAVYSAGQHAAAAIMDARKRVAKCLGCTPRQIIFTSGGTESDNQALASLALRRLGSGKSDGGSENSGLHVRNKIITFQFEHAAVLRSVERLSQFGFDVEVLPVFSDGVVQVNELLPYLTDDVLCVSMMMVNNEVGTIQPVQEVARLCKERGILFHCDAVQAAGHIPIHINDWEIGTLAISAHKFHGPKGVGVLVHQPNDYVEPLIVGGGQERGFRSGTSNTPGAVGCAAALEEACAHMEENSQSLWEINDVLRAGILRIPDSRLTGTADHSKRVPGILHFCFKDIDAQTLLIYLDAHGICASAGSACMAGAVQKSNTLVAMGVPDVWARGALRLSFDASITLEEAHRVCDVVAQGVAAQRDRA